MSDTQTQTPLEKHAYLRDRNAEYEAQGLTLQESQRAVVELYDYAARLEAQLAEARADNATAGEWATMQRETIRQNGELIERLRAGTWQPVERRVFFPFGESYVHVAENGVMNVGTGSNGPSVSFLPDKDYAFCRLVPGTPATVNAELLEAAEAVVAWLEVPDRLRASDARGNGAIWEQLRAAVERAKEMQP